MKRGGDGHLPWNDGTPTTPGVYIIWDGNWQRRMEWDGRQWVHLSRENGGSGLRWFKRGEVWIRNVFPEPVRWRENDPKWGTSEMRTQNWSFRY